MSDSQLVEKAPMQLRKERPELYRYWIRDGVQNVARFIASKRSDVNATWLTLENLTPIEQDVILGFLIRTTIKIQFSFNNINEAERLLEVGSEARQTVRHHFEGRAGEHILEARRPTFAKFYPNNRKIEKYHTCTESRVVNCLDDRLLNKPESIIRKMREEQESAQLGRFNNPPRNVDQYDRIANFQRSAQLLTLIGNVNDFTFDIGVEAAIDYYKNYKSIQVDDLLSVPDRLISEDSP